jgi:hypothetical protein
MLTLTMEMANVTHIPVCLSLVFKSKWSNHRFVTYRIVWAFLRNKHGTCNDPTNPATDETGGSTDGPLRVRHDIVGLKSQNTRDTKL